MLHYRLFPPWLLLCAAGLRAIAMYQDPSCETGNNFGVTAPDDGRVGLRSESVYANMGRATSSDLLLVLPRHSSPLRLLAMLLDMHGQRCALCSRKLCSEWQYRIRGSVDLTWTN